MTAVAQSPARGRPKLKDFGDSLERLKWDERRRASVETKPRKVKEPKRGGEEDEEVVRVETSLVVCDVLVLDRQGRAVRGLTRDDFVVTEDGKPPEVGTFSLGDDARVPRSTVLIIDYSGFEAEFLCSRRPTSRIVV